MGHGVGGETVKVDTESASLQVDRVSSDEPRTPPSLPPSLSLLWFWGCESALFGLYLDLGGLPSGHIITDTTGPTEIFACQPKTYLFLCNGIGSSDGCFAGMCICKDDNQHGQLTSLGAPGNRI